ncbi:MAG: helix-turn-helix domain-containing protein [Pseudomonadota bacterium]
MVVRKLRLQHSWSQEQLAEMAGVSVRTIQRIERGNPPSLETAKALAAVFEVNVDALHKGTQDMHTDIPTEPNPAVSADEGEAMQYVKGLKEFYQHAGMFALFAVVFLIFKRPDEPKLLWAFAGWGVGVVLHGLVAFEVINLFNAGWEKRTIEKRLGRKL